MAIKSDKWIIEQAQKNQLINLYRKFKIYPVKISEEEKWITITFKKKNEKAH